MRDDVFDHLSFDQRYNFGLPRVALSFTPSPRASAFASWSYAEREPSFQDLYDGEGVGALPLFRYAVPPSNFSNPLIRPEHVNDYELGGSWALASGDAGSTSATLNLFRMDFRDELVFAGQFNTDLGYPILGNAARSVHQGMEVALHGERGLAHGVRASLEGNATLSDNYFVRYREVYGLTSADSLSYDGNKIALFPAVMGNLSGRLRVSGVTLGADVQHIGRIYIDNTQSLINSIGPHTVLNLSAAWRAPVAGTSGAELSVRVLNATNNYYATTGYMDYDAAGNLVPQFTPAALRSVLGQVRVDF